MTSSLIASAMVRDPLYHIECLTAPSYTKYLISSELRHDPVLATLAGKLAARRRNCAPLAGKSTLNRLELSRAEPTRYNKLAADEAAIEALFIDLFLDAHRKAPDQITLDLDATATSRSAR